MNGSERAVPAGCRWLLGAAARLVPEDVRRDWHREWRAELDWAAAQHDARTGQRFTDGRLMMRCAGACAHAAWLRWDRWRPDMWSYDVKIAMRSLWRQPGFMALAVLTLAVGIGANAAIFSAVQAVLLRPLPFPDAHRLVAVFTAGPKLRPGESSPPDFVDWHGVQTSLAGGLAALTADSFAVTGRASAEQVPGASVTGDFFGVLGVSALRGRTLEPRDARAGASPVVVLGHGLWVRRFGQAPEVIGSTVIVDGVPREVVGILPPGREYPLGSELWVPLTFTDQELATQRGAQYLDVIGRLGPDVPMAGAQAELSGIAHRLAAAYPASNAGRDVVVRDLRASLVGDVRPALLMVLIAAGLVLVIVCANVAGLLLTRALARSHDVAVRTALGASRGRLVRAALVESVLLGIAGGGVGLMLAWVGARGIATLDVSLGIPRMATTRVDGVVVAVTAAVSVLSAAVFGVAPAWRAMAFADVARRVRAAGPRFSRSRGRGALVIAEVAVALVLVVGALTLVRSFARLTSVDLGFEASEHVQTFALTLPDARYGAVADREQFIDRLLTRLRGLPGVQSAGAVFGLPLTSFGYSISVFERDGVSVPDTPET